MLGIETPFEWACTLPSFWHSVRFTWFVQHCTHSYFASRLCIMTLHHDSGTLFTHFHRSSVHLLRDARVIG